MVGEDFCFFRGPDFAYFDKNRDVCNSEIKDVVFSSCCVVQLNEEIVMENFDETIPNVSRGCSCEFQEICGRLKSPASIIFALFEQTPPRKLLNLSNHI